MTNVSGLSAQVKQAIQPQALRSDIAAGNASGPALAADQCLID
jgi:hypothetical protein